MILGMSFGMFLSTSVVTRGPLLTLRALVRNVYALFDFGDFTGNGQEKGDPYVQFLSTTDPAQGAPTPLAYFNI
jgi:hypothetical protein